MALAAPVSPIGKKRRDPPAVFAAHREIIQLKRAAKYGIIDRNDSGTEAA